MTLQLSNQRPFPAEVPQTHQYCLPGLDRKEPRRFQGGFTFDQFVTGPSNRFAYLATLALASEQNIYNNALLPLLGQWSGENPPFARLSAAIC